MIHYWIIQITLTLSMAFQSFSGPRHKMKLNLFIKFTASSLIAAAAMFFGANPAKAVGPITFTADPTGSVPNGYSPLGFPEIQFSDTIGSDLQIGDYTHQSNGNGLAAFWDDPSSILMKFLVPVNSLAFDFGNDDPCCSSSGDIALLKLFSGATNVGQASVVMNRDDIMNQTISFAGVNFDSALFAYANSSGNPINLIEVIDNVTYTQAVNVPGPLPIFGLAAAFGYGRKLRSRLRAGKLRVSSATD